MLTGLLELPVWGYIAVTLVATHITIAAVTIYLHRAMAHRALDLHPLVAHFFRMWLWLTTGQVTRQWIAVHRKHHAKVETEEDPHSPQVYGIRKLLLEGAELYRIGVRDKETLERYGHGAPDDWLERHVYTPHSDKGYFLTLALNVILFGPIGLTIWAVQMLWIPVTAAGVINGVGHWWGYRNFETADASTNIVPFGIVIGGEELHNNHHAFASSAKLSSKWWEFDIGWLYIRTLETLGLARVKKVAPEPIIVPGKVLADLDSVKGVIGNRLQVMSQYAKIVLTRVYHEELERADHAKRSLLRRVKTLLVREESRLSLEARDRLDAALSHSHALQTVYQYKMRLQAIWQERTASHERLLQSLQEWCRGAEASGIRALQEFARTLPTYSVKPA
ncbi:MAG: acyl-CoA desaturase [Gammaproteobacteria bacterium]|nr:acyl-CoA desaturase [Gammaproteobacteria bacterium]NIM72497.1 acyl-CoA desaturase [Gammaproteobacteria bacterium]NIO24256.1 acyl-CoA desaturase [Gammaproteobacteria bacterium]NIO64861.1 acyl-CoA desaturase [Gammaproteobacteria bacterium]NIP44903.1 acyl-CoA desaturase [Gammaproteobacteria bacterium]